MVDNRSERITVAPGCELATYVRARPSGAVIFFAHATGLHARVFDPLADLLDDCYVVAYDARGHGVVPRARNSAVANARRRRSARCALGATHGNATATTGTRYRSLDGRNGTAHGGNCRRIAV